mgnify:CR=1 FL=1|jgi:hypothetical protein
MACTSRGHPALSTAATKAGEMGRASTRPAEERKRCEGLGSGAGGQGQGCCMFKQRLGEIMAISSSTVR